VAIPHTTFLNHPCNPHFLPIVTKHMLATVHEHCIYLKHHAKCIFPQGTSTLLAYAWSTWDQPGVHSPMESQPEVSQLPVSILTTSWSVMSLHTVSSGAPHPLDLQAHLTMAKSSGDTCQRVNAIPVLQWLQPWIQFTHSSQLASTYHF